MTHEDVNTALQNFIDDNKFGPKNYEDGTSPTNFTFYALDDDGYHPNREVRVKWDGEKLTLSVGKFDNKMNFVPTDTFKFVLWG